MPIYRIKHVPRGIWYSSLRKEISHQIAWTAFVGEASGFRTLQGALLYPRSLKISRGCSVFSSPFFSLFLDAQALGPPVQGVHQFAFLVRQKSKQQIRVLVESRDYRQFFQKMVSSWMAKFYFMIDWTRKWVWFGGRTEFSGQFSDVKSRGIYQSTRRKKGEKLSILQKISPFFFLKLLHPQRFLHFIWKLNLFTFVNDIQHGFFKVFCISEQNFYNEKTFEILDFKQKIGLIHVKLVFFLRNDESFYYLRE